MAPGNAKKSATMSAATPGESIPLKDVLMVRPAMLSPIHRLKDSLLNWPTGMCKVFACCSQTSRKCAGHIHAFRSAGSEVCVGSAVGGCVTIGGGGGGETDIVGGRVF